MNPTYDAFGSQLQRTMTPRTAPTPGQATAQPQPGAMGPGQVRMPVPQQPQVPGGFTQMPKPPMPSYPGAPGGISAYPGGNPGWDAGAGSRPPQAPPQAPPVYTGTPFMPNPGDGGPLLSQPPRQNPPLDMGNDFGGVFVPPTQAPPKAPPFDTRPITPKPPVGGVIPNPRPITPKPPVGGVIPNPPAEGPPLTHRRRAPVEDQPAEPAPTTMPVSRSTKATPAPKKTMRSQIAGGFDQQYRKAKPIREVTSEGNGRRTKKPGGGK